MDPPRRVAYDVLRAVEERDTYVNLALPALLRERQLIGRDAAFATELTSGTVRGQGTYDAIIDALVSHRLDPAVRNVLRLGVHQLLAMRTPAHAAVSTSVDLVRLEAGERPARLVNAVLRKVGGRSLEHWVAEVGPDRADDLAGHLAVAHSHPRWIVEAFAEALDHDWVQTEHLLRADNVAPKVTLVARPGRVCVGDLARAGAQPGRWSPFAATLPTGDPGSIAAVRAGDAGVQDEGSQLVALALSEAVVVGPDALWLDSCAGPGGKAALLAALAGQRGAALLAAELQAHRAVLVQRAVRGAGGVLGLVVADSTRPAWSAEAFDRVLVDAPCSGLGALRRRPEARWRRSPADLERLVPLQRALLGAALDSCRVGGVVVYATCSPLPAETRGVVDAVLAGRDDVREEDARPLIAVPDVGPGPHAQLWPHRHGTDAMFLAVLRRVGAAR
ncbi:MAG TPA: transcription antitermination factor NusB [Nocardioidaceae bacterium]|nr:transcription antitermination factor NusB [Nocardioidaceae bacterium]